jgi:tetratricopeptide (TPR) repeat protein
MDLRYTRQIKFHFKNRLFILLILFSGILFGLPFTGNFLFSPRQESAVGDSIIKQGGKNPDSAYYAIMTKANEFFQAGKNREALNEYEKALKLKPGDMNLKQTIEKVKARIAQQDKAMADYMKAVASGDSYFKAKDYLNAKSAYQMAIDLIPDDPIAKDKLKQTMDLIRSQKAQNTLYDMAIAGAEKYFQAKDYEKAKTEFEKANKILPSDNYAKQRINEIIKIMVDLQAKEEDYAKAIAAADKFYQAKSYQSALGEYQTASSIKPEEKYPKDRITELTALIKSIKAKNDAYDKAIAAADKAFAGALYADAKKGYQEALTIKPEEIYPKNKIREIDDILAGKQRNQDEFNRLVNLGDSLYIEKKYITAKANYQQALKLKPNEAYPKDMIAKTDNMISGQAANAQATEEAYQAAIKSGDNSFAEKSWDKAKSEYQNALLIKPGETYPAGKITEIDKILANIAKNKSLDEQYTTLITQADKQMGDKQYPDAKSTYQSALKLKPDQQYPKDKIAEIDNALGVLAKQKAADDQYNAAIARADKLFTDKMLDQSKAQYIIAGNIKPDEVYPKQRIADIDKLLADAAAVKALDDKYHAVITNADNLFAAKSYDEAKTEYSNALQVKPDEQYPKDRIGEIDKLATALADAKAKDERYQQIIGNADKLLADKSYDKAKTEYQNALALKPQENYPKTKISEIDKALADIAKQKSLDDQYSGLIADADKQLAAKAYPEAKSAYQSALKLKPDQLYPRDKIAEIDQSLAELAKLKAMDDQYDASIAKADKLFTDKLFEQSKAEYIIAGKLKPDETYPKEKITEIDNMLADAAAKKALDEKYQSMIANADKLMASKDYSTARTEYSNASLIRPDQQYPKEKIAEIDKILAAVADAKAKDEQYQSIIENADKLLAAKSFEQAKSEYQGALALKPEEAYPKTKINEIDLQLSAIAKQKALDDQYSGLIADADKQMAEKSYALAKTGYESAMKLKPDQQYPKDKITEIDNALAGLAKQKAIDDQYDATIAKADKSFTDKNLEQAKTEYAAAMNLKPGESYPKQKISEIDKMLANIAAQKALDEKYQGILLNADKLLATRNYPNAKTEYTNASNVKPDATYPKEKIRQIDSIVGAIAEAKARDDQYTALIQKADKLLTTKNYDQAKTEYQNALAIKPDETYPKTKIGEIDLQLAAIAKQKALDDQYSGLIAEADAKLAEKAWDEAKIKYQAALDLKPDQTYPKGKITEIEKALSEIARVKAVDEKYSVSITKADKLFADNMLDEAKAEYLTAGSIKPGEAYPKQKIADIEKLKTEAAQKKALDDKYNSAIQNADKLLAQSNYTLAKTEYANASQIKPQEQYPKDKISEIEGIVAEMKAKDEAYNASITKADQFLAQKSYEDARSEYNNASMIKPSEQYPKNKVAEINNILMQLKGKRETFDGLVRKGDDYFSQQDFYQSKENFEQASVIFPDEAYPKQKLTRINSIIDSIYRANKGKYDKAIADGDKAFNSLIYDKALDFYAEASSYLPNEKYPKEMISKIKKAISENAIVDVVKSTITIMEGTEKRIEFASIDIAARKNNYLYIKIRNLSNKPFNVLVRYGKDKQMNGGAVIKNLQADGNVYDRLISVRDQDPWYREDNNWIALLPQGGDIEVTFIQISRAVQ